MVIKTPQYFYYPNQPGINNTYTSIKVGMGISEISHIVSRFQPTISVHHDFLGLRK